MLPEHDLVILDEAHAFADNATSAFGADLSPDILVRLSGMLARAGVEPKTVDALANAAKHLANVVEKREGRVDVGNDEQLSSALHSAAERLAAANSKLGRPDTDGGKRASQLAVARLEVLRRLGAPAEEDVVWIEKVRNTHRIRVAPVTVGGPVGSFLLDARPVIAVSATLGGAPPFPGFAFAMGFDPTRRPAPGARRTTTASATRKRGAATSRCRRRRRSTGRNRDSSTSARTFPIPAAPGTRGWSRPATVCVAW